MCIRDSPGNGQGDSGGAAVALGCAAAGADAIHKVVAPCITDDLFVGLALMGLSLIHI